MITEENVEEIFKQKSSLLSKGIYVNQLKIWTALFPKEQILILSTENLSCDPNAVKSEPGVKQEPRVSFKPDGTLGIYVIDDDEPETPILKVERIAVAAATTAFGQAADK